MRQQWMRFGSAFVREDEIWCVPRSVNRLFGISMKDWSVRSICDLKLTLGFRIDSVFLYQDDVWCVTATGSKVIEYNLLSREIRHFDMGRDRRINREIFLYNGKIWMIPEGLPGEVICFDIEKRKFSVYGNWEKECLKKGIRGTAKVGCLAGNILSVPLLEECKVIQYDLKEEIMRVRTLPGEAGLRCALQICGHNYALVDGVRMLFSWKEGTEEVRRYDCPYLCSTGYIMGIEFENGILLADGERTDYFDILSGKIETYDSSFPKDLKLDCGAQVQFLGGLKYGDKFFLLPLKANMLLIYDGRSRKWQGRILKIPEDIFYEEYIGQRVENGWQIYEDELLLKDYIKYIKNVWCEGAGSRGREQVGSGIYHQMKIIVEEQSYGR